MGSIRLQRQIQTYIGKLLKGGPNIDRLSFFSGHEGRRLNFFKLQFVVMGYCTHCTMYLFVYISFVQTDSLRGYSLPSNSVLAIRISRYSLSGFV